MGRCCRFELPIHYCYQYNPDRNVSFSKFLIAILFSRPAFIQVGKSFSNWHYTKTILVDTAKCSSQALFIFGDICYYQHWKIDLHSRCFQTTAFENSSFSKANVISCPPPKINFRRRRPYSVRLLKPTQPTSPNSYHFYAMIYMKTHLGICLYYVFTIYNIHFENAIVLLPIYWSYFRF